MNVAFMRQELASLVGQYDLIRDAILGEVAIKAGRTRYLPMPKGIEDATERNRRYADYLLRAVYYNVTRRTMMGLVGYVFSKAPEKNIPELLEVVEKNADGAGVSLIQQSKSALMYTLAYSRAGLFVDYPDTSSAASMEDIETGRIRPTISLYTPQEVVNWRIETLGAEDVLTLVVLSERFKFFDDGFEFKEAQQFRVLRLENGVYVQELWREEVPTDYGAAEKNTFMRHSVFMPKDASGNNLREIPFTFIGSINNDSNPDAPNFYDLASLNIAHYRNSADYEESCYMVGQPTAVITGLDENWATKVLNGKIDFGSRGGIPLPAGADAKLIQAAPNTMIKEAMETKERQMVALGAKLVEQKSVQRTAFEAGIEAANEGSVLASCSDNVSNAYELALNWCALFVGYNGDDIKYRLSTNYDLSKMPVNEILAVVEAWQRGAITREEMRERLVKSGWASLDYDEYAAKTEEPPQPEPKNPPPAQQASRIARNPIGA